MRKSQWNEDDIENLLHKLPKIKDKREPEAIYQSIQKETRVNFIKRNWTPLIAVACAVLFLSILAAPFLSDENSNKSTEKSSEADSVYSTTYDKDRSINKKESQSENEIFNTSEAVNTTALFSIDEDDQSFITLAVPDKKNENYFVPVTILVEKIGTDKFGEEIMNQMTSLDAEALGLSNYYPLDVQVKSTMKADAVTIDFPKDSKLLEQDIYLTSILNASFKYQDIHRIIYTTDGEKGVHFAHMGELRESVIHHIEKKAYLLYQYDAQMPCLLVPTNVGFETIHEALAATKLESQAEGLYPSVPAEISWEKVIQKDSSLIIQFTADTKLENTQSSLQAIEAILFTAKDFGFKKVQFLDSPINTIGPLHLSEAIPVPLAPNKIN